MNLDRWAEVFQTLSRNKLRTCLTALGVFWGVFMLVVMLGFGRGLETGTVGALSRWAANTISVWPTGTILSHNGHPPGRRVRFALEDAEIIRREVPGVLAVAPRVYGGWGMTRTVSRAGKTEALQVSGEVPEFPLLEPVTITAGRFVNPADLNESRKVAVLGQAIQEALFRPDENAVGQEIRIGAVPFVVIGVFKSEAQGPAAEWIESRVIVPMTTFARMIGRRGQVDQFTVLLAPRVNSELAEKQAQALLKRKYGIHPQDPGGIDSWNREKEFRRLMNLFDGIAALSWTVGVLTLLAGILGVSNILMISVAERTREIGIRKAIGARPGSILLQIIEESMVLTGLAGSLGLVAGVGFLALSSVVVRSLPKESGPSFFASPDLDLGTAMIATVVLTLAGGIAGIAPARSALAIKPVEALAHE